MPDTSTAFLRLLPAAVPLCLSCALADAAEFLRPRPLMEYHDVMLAQELDTALVTLNDRQKKCVNAGKASPNECACRYPAEASIAMASFDKALQARPAWKGKILYWKNPDNQASRQLVMPAIEHQLKTALSACRTSAATD